jgi:tetratricopeptide (TPR) repeat protein
MRMWLLAMLAGLLPSPGAQDLPKSDPPPAHKICGGDDTAPKRPMLLTGYGRGGFAISTTVPLAQQYFDNGMQLGASFAHKASIAAMQEAVRLDPTCAMCLWGDAWASGPTINYGIQPADRVKQAAKLRTAETLAQATGTPLERDLIAALKLRYMADGKPGSANLAFAQAMDAIADAHPTDAALATLAADARLIASFDQKATPARASQYRSVDLLQRVLARDPDYTPAIHFYIHATEIVEVPDRATPYADRLRALAPSASHLVHMPSHTYYWIGRYQDAADANVRAVALGIDNARRLGMTLPDGVWDLPYHAHNVHFGVGGAMMSGDAKTALLLSDPLVAVAAKRDKGSVFQQAVAGMGYAAEGRFADPAAVMALPEPRLPYSRAFWRYARGEAQARLGDAQAVRSEAAAIRAGIATRGKDAMTDKTGIKLVRIAELVLTGRAAMIDRRLDVALKAFRAAMKIEEARPITGYSDPPVWWYPVRRSVAEARLAGGDARGALADAEATLKRRPNDPMTLAVRARAQSALGNAAAARGDARAALAGWRGDRRAFRRALI